MTERNGLALALGAVILGVAAGAAAVDVVGATQATIAWSPASGPVTGYYVVVSRDASPSQVEAVSLDAVETVSGAFGETLVVQVAAFGADGVAGPLSASSEPIHFVSSSGGGDGGSGGGDDDPLPGGGDPDPGSTDPGVRHDHDGDGAADVVVRIGSAARLWRMQGSRVVGQVPLPDVPDGAQLVGRGDYDGNRSADLLWENPKTGVLTLWRLDGGAVVGSGALDRSSLPADESWQVGGSGDLDGDGRDDVLLFSRKRGEIEIWTFGDSGVSGRSRLAGHTGAWSVVAVADTDGDGVAEAVWLDEIERALVLEAPGAAPLALGTLAPTWRVIGAADGDGDGRSELLLHEPATGATQAWHLDANGIAGTRDLPLAAGTYAGGGDFDGDGREDAVWGDAASGVVTLWLDTGGMPAVVEADMLLGDAELLAAAGSDPSAFLDRFCSGDVDGNGSVTSGDFQSGLIQCYEGSTREGCDAADLDGDGAVTQTDIAIFLMRYAGQTCEDR